MNVEEVLCQRVKWALLVHVRAQWQALVNTVPYEARKFLPTKRLSASEKGLCTLLLVVN
jgi:hypothetical protein